MTLDIGTEYSISDTIGDLLSITIPTGDKGEGQTLVNDGTKSLFWRARDPSLTPAGNAATLIASPFFCSRLKQGEYLWKAGITLQVVCATGESSTLRVVPGKLGSSLLLEAAVNVGVNIGLLNKAEVEIDPATEDKQDDNITQTTAVNTVLGATADSIVVGDNTGSVSAKLRGMNSNIDKVTRVLGDETYAEATDEAFVIAGVRASARTSLVDTNNEFAPFQLTSNGDVRVRDDDANTVLGTIDADTGAIKTAIELIDHLTAANSGNKDANTQRIAIATDDILTLAIKNAAEGNGVLTEKVPTWLTVVVTTPGTPEPFAVDGTFATYVSVEAKRDDGDNVDDVYIRDSSVDKDGAQGHVLGPGEPWDLTAAPGTKFDLNDLQFDAVDTDDGLEIQYQPA